jgi:SAM-dependent methyltransferase
MATFPSMDDGGHFGEPMATTYDESSDPHFAADEVDATVDLLVELAGVGRALEFGVGTGRIALPLAGRGVAVHGIDLSRAMVDQLRDKPGSDLVEVTIGDFATTRVDGSFSLVYLVFNTIMNLPSQAEQVACFRNAAAHLEPGGRFVIEVGVPGLRRLPPGQSTLLWAQGPTGWAYDVYDTASQSLTGHYLDIVNGRGSYHTTPFRYVWPAELDLMAELAGLQLRDRWAGWGREPFTHDSERHVSVWERPSAIPEG